MENGAGVFFFAKRPHLPLWRQESPWRHAAPALAPAPMPPCPSSGQRRARRAHLLPRTSFSPSQFSPNRDLALAPRPTPPRQSCRRIAAAREPAEQIESHHPLRIVALFVRVQGIATGSAESSTTPRLLLRNHGRRRPLQIADDRGRPGANGRCHLHRLAMLHLHAEGIGPGSPQATSPSDPLPLRPPLFELALVAAPPPSASPNPSSSSW